MGQQDPRQNQGGGQAVVAEKIARGVVARGRTVDVPEGEKLIVNHTLEGRPVYRRAIRSYGPGHEVELPAAEIASLRERGFLIDPGQPLPPLGDGPHYTETGSHANAA